MFDDLEDLLDYTSLNSKPTLGKDKTKVIEKSNDEFSIDDLLSMTMDEDVGKDEAERKHSSSTCDVITPSKNQNLVLGGADADVGNNGSCLMKVATKSISCVQCDMVVNRWQGKSWKPEADYIFFRNNAPDRSKMEVMLRREEGSAAYACQCSWVSVNQMIALNQGDSVEGRTLRWTVNL